MAVAAQQQTQIIHGDNGFNVGRVVDTVVDERTGLTAQHERVFATVPDEHGNVNVIMQEEIRVIQVVSLVLQISVIKFPPLAFLFSHVP